MKRFKLLLIVLFIVIGNSLLSIPIKAVDYHVSNMADLISNINGVNNGDVIIIDDSFMVNQTITINNGKKFTIQGKDNTISLQRDIGFVEIMFDISDNSEVTLSNLIIDGGSVWFDVNDLLNSANNGVVAQNPMIMVDNAKLFVNECLLQNNDNNKGSNSAEAYGGAIWGKSNTDITVVESTFENNRSISTFSAGGGAIAIVTGAKENNSSLTIDNSFFKNNVVSYIYSNYIHYGSGGHIYFSDGKDLSINNTNFSKGSAGFGGGVMASSFTGNINISASVFDNNKTELNMATGGALVIDKPYVTTGNSIVANVVDCTFKNNKSNRTGAVFIRTYEAENTVVNFTNNTVENNASVATTGGVEIASSKYVNLTRNRITNNTGSYAGGMLINRSSDIIMNNDQITKNSASNSAGGLYVFSSKNVVANDLLISENEITNINSVGTGGVQIALNSSVTFNNFNVVKNNGVKYAGGIRVERGSTFVGNNGNIIENGFVAGSSELFGGGLHVLSDVNYDKSVATLNNCNVNNNLAENGGAIAATSGAIVNINNSTLKENKAEYGGAIINDSSLVNIFNSNALNNRANVDGGVIYNYNNSETNYLGTSNATGNVAVGKGSFVFQDATFNLAGATSKYNGDVHLEPNRFIGLVNSCSVEFQGSVHTDSPSDDLDGRTIVAPSTVTYNGLTYSLLNTETYVGNFYHNTKGTIEGSLESTHDTDTKNIVLGGYRVVFDGNRPSGVVDVVSGLSQGFSLKPTSVIVNAVKWPVIDPDLKGYTFVGYSIDTAGTQMINSDDIMPSRNIVLYAQWQRAEKAPNTGDNQVVGIAFSTSAMVIFAVFVIASIYKRKNNR